MRHVQRGIINAGGMLLTFRIVPGVSLRDDVFARALLTFLGVLAIVGLVNLTVGPIAKLLELRLMFVVLSVLVWMANGALLLVLSAVSRGLGLGFHVAGIGPACLGAVIIAAVAILFTWLLPAAIERHSS